MSKTPLPRSSHKGEQVPDTPVSSSSKYFISSFSCSTGRPRTSTVERRVTRVRPRWVCPIPYVSGLKSQALQTYLSRTVNDQSTGTVQYTGTIRKESQQ